MLSEILDEISEFETQFSRCRGLLHFIASRVLGGFEGAEQAVENCFRAASRHPMSFEYEGEFRSWLLRILVDEARVIRGRQQIQRERSFRRERGTSPSS